MANQSIEDLNREIESCQKCSRLRRHCLNIGKLKRRSFKDDDYWTKPIQGFGDLNAEVLIVGLAPAAHGANRTGRIFTGDRSGDWLFRALHKSGFANQAHSLHRKDSLQLNRIYVTSAVRCAPPDNKPSTAESLKCAPYLKQEIALLKKVKIFIVLGQFGYQALWNLLDLKISRPKFGHGVEIKLPDARHLLISFHPSQQNTFTGKLTEQMFDSIFNRASELLGDEKASGRKIKRAF